MVPKWFDWYINKTLKIQNNLKKALKDYRSICPKDSVINIRMVDNDILIDVETKHEPIDVLGNTEVKEI